MKLIRKISLFSGLFTTTMILLIGVIVYIQWVSTLKKQLELSARDLAVTIAEMDSVKYNLTRSNGFLPLQRIAEELKLTTRTQYIHILDARGIYYAHTFPAYLGTEERDPLIRYLLDSPPTESVIRRSDSFLMPSVEALVPVYYQGELAGLVIAGMLNGRIFQDIRMNLESLVLLLILAVFISLFSSRKLAESIKRSMHDMEPNEIARLLGQRAMTLENLKEGIITLDQDGVIIYFNRAAHLLAGLSPADKDKSVQFYFFREEFYQCLESGEPLLTELISPGGLTLQCRLEPIIAGESGAFLGITIMLEDLTEVRARAEEITGIRQINEGLRAQNHEFLNKLHTISGMIELEEYREAVEFINGISHSRKEMTGKLGRLIRNPSVAGLLLGKYNRAQELKISFILDEESFLEEDRGKGDLVCLVLGNLVENALEELKGKSGGTLFVSLKSEEDELTILVADNGAGVKDKEAIFEKGYSSKGEGRGLGLYLVRKNIIREGGEIGVGSREGLTEFRVTLPLEKREGPI